MEYFVYNYSKQLYFEFSVLTLFLCAFSNKVFTMHERYAFMVKIHLLSVKIFNISFRGKISEVSLSLILFR